MVILLSSVSSYVLLFLQFSLSVVPPELMFQQPAPIESKFSPKIGVVGLNITSWGLPVKWIGCVSNITQLSSSLFCLLPLLFA